jgi:hypothetical protein
VVDSGGRLREKLGKVADSPVSWGGVGLIAGALAPVWAVWFVSLGGFITWVALLQARFFAGRRFAVAFSGHLVLVLAISFLLYVAWVRVPKSPEPLTKQDIFNAVKEVVASAPASSPQTTATSNDAGSGASRRECPSSVGSGSRLPGIRTKRIVRMVLSIA